MVHEQLENLVRIGRLKAEGPTPAEIAGLVRSGLARLKDAKLDHLSIESRFDLAYSDVFPKNPRRARHPVRKGGEECRSFA